MGIFTKFISRKKKLNPQSNAESKKTKKFIIDGLKKQLEDEIKAAKWRQESLKEAENKIIALKELIAELGA